MTKQNSPILFRRESPHCTSHPKNSEFVDTHKQLVPERIFISENTLALMRGVILQIEDDLQDVELFRLAVAQSGSPCKVISVAYARDAIMYLGRFGEYADVEKYPKPTLIVLDLSLPGMTGLEFLAWAKGEPPETIPPIVVLSYSKLELNRHLSEKLGAKAFFIKSPNPNETADITKKLLLFGAPPSNPTQSFQRPS